MNSCRQTSITGTSTVISALGNENHQPLAVKTWVSEYSHNTWLPLALCAIGNCFFPLILKVRELEEADAIKIVPKAMLIPVLSEMGLLDAKYEHCRLWRAAEGRRGGRRHHRHQAGPHPRAARRHQVTDTTPYAQVVQHFLPLLVRHI